MLPAASSKWASTECQQFELLRIWWTSHRANLLVHNGIIDPHHWQKYNIPNVKFWFQINLYCKLQSIQQHIIRCWKRHFNKIQLTNSKMKIPIWIYRWTRWATCWQPAQFGRVRSFPLNRTPVDGSGLLTTWTANLATVRFGPGRGPNVTVRNRCYHHGHVHISTTKEWTMPTSTTFRRTAESWPYAICHASGFDRSCTADLAIQFGHIVCHGEIE